MVFVFKKKKSYKNKNEKTYILVKHLNTLENEWIDILNNGSPYIETNMNFPKIDEISLIQSIE